MIEIQEISAEQTYGIRLEVLRKGIQKPYKFKGDFDEDTFHLGAFYKKELVGIATFMKSDNKLTKDKSQYQLRGMATLSKVRGKGVGKSLLEQAERILKSKSIEILWCNAREVAVPFYEKINFNIIGAPFLIEDIGKHYIMMKSLK